MHNQKTVSTYLYLLVKKILNQSLYVTQDDTKPKRIIWMWISTVFFYIGHSLFDIRREGGYLLDIRNIGHWKFDIQILVK